VLRGRSLSRIIFLEPELEPQWEALSGFGSGSGPNVKIFSDEK
jgi:hypothetical protein